MTAEHDDFILQIATRNFGNCVVGHVVLVLVFDLEINCHFQIYFLLDHAQHAVVCSPKPSSAEPFSLRLLDRNS